MSIDPEPARRNVERLTQHLAQVESGEVPEDAPFELEDLPRDEVAARLDRIALHQEQVLAGFIPADGPPDLVRPEVDATLGERGLPWWFGAQRRAPSDPGGVVVAVEGGEVEDEGNPIRDEDEGTLR